MWDGYMAEIRIFAGGFEPAGWSFCDGRLLSIAASPWLFALVGTTFGGNGLSNFALPRIVHPNPALRYIVCVDGIYPRS
jgi:microcystin-dependent protein